MKTARLLLATGLGWLLLPLTAIAEPQSSPPGPALPPPALHDPGVRASAPAAGSVASPMAPPAVALPSMHDDGTARDEAAPEVTIHQRGDDSDGRANTAFRFWKQQQQRACQDRHDHRQHGKLSQPGIQASRSCPST